MIATLEDLYRTDGKAELIGGKITRMMASGFLPGRIAGRIFFSLESSRNKRNWVLRSEIMWGTRSSS